MKYNESNNVFSSVIKTDNAEYRIEYDSRLGIIKCQNKDGKVRTAKVRSFQEFRDWYDWKVVEDIA